VGDSYFKLKTYDKAGEWFAKAIKIDADKETAYRYWGDSLMAEGKMMEARSKFIEAYIVQPYTKTSGFALQNWAKANKVQIGHPLIQSPNSVTKKDDKNITITIDSKADDSDGRSAWMIYDLNRASWQGDEFKKRFPNEKAYRHTVTEEAEGLGMVVTSLEGIQSSKKLQKIDPALQTLVKLKRDGLLEPFVLLAKADNGIAQDYYPYLKDHRDKLRKYMEDYVVPAVTAANATQAK
jgi:tetratricopeptide (TPR) repeat protein